MVGLGLIIFALLKGVVFFYHKKITMKSPCDEKYVLDVPTILVLSQCKLFISRIQFLVSTLEQSKQTWFVRFTT